MREAQLQPVVCTVVQARLSLDILCQLFSFLSSDCILVSLDPNLGAYTEVLASERLTQGWVPASIEKVSAQGLITQTTSLLYLSCPLAALKTLHL